MANFLLGAMNRLKWKEISIVWLCCPLALGGINQHRHSPEFDFADVERLTPSLTGLVRLAKEICAQHDKSL